MFTNVAFLVVMTNIAIITFMGVMGYITQSPLVILGILLLQQVPFIQNADDTEAVGEESDYSESDIGFNAKL